MRLLILPPAGGLVIAALPATPEAVRDALATPAWASLRLAFADGEVYPGMQPPEGLLDLDRANPVIPSSAAPVTVVAKLDFYRRCSDAEAGAVEAAVAQQGPRLRAIFKAAQTFRSDADEWAALQGAATVLFGEARAAELLAPSVNADTPTP